MDKRELSYISPNAKIGKNVEIGPFVTIEDNVEIGDNTVIDSNATIHSGARIGKNCHIHAGASISDIPQDLKFKGEKTLTIIGDHTNIREFATVHRGTASKGKTVVGSYCLIMAYCHVAHDCVLGDHVIMSNTTQLAGEVVVGDWAVIGGGTLVHQFTHIGQHVMMQGGSLVSKDVPPFAMAGRFPLVYEGVNSVGLRRRGFSQEQIDTVQDVYRRLYHSELNVTAAVAKIREDMPQSQERDTVLDFVAKSSRGIIRSSV